MTVKQDKIESERETETEATRASFAADEEARKAFEASWDVDADDERKLAELRAGVRETLDDEGRAAFDAVPKKKQEAFARYMQTVAFLHEESGPGDLFSDLGLRALANRDDPAGEVLSDISEKMQWLKWFAWHFPRHKEKMASLLEASLL